MTAKGYWIARITVHDADGYARYVAAANPVYTAFGGTPLVRGGRFEISEGETRPRNVVIEFPSYQAAMDCYRSAEYQAARAIRQQAADGEVVVVEGAEVAG
ncbi:DUF1330 domain-containing protein [Flexivirga caeni]|uniref:DUF1330 domain-containing protein n=1 Tax=Flexivirga caeni TaxID=2294115 RepID=A0A3M9MKN4_9MICO|nr:DUF1330 domain-containing protein [Flexivirga caeni]RNI25228.1 DUF1330 domain-containing protein [Flexivirga caeni]